MKKILLLILTFSFFFIDNEAQKVNFRKYGIEQELCNSQIYRIIQDKNGFIWLGTGDGLCKYNGFEFTSPFNDSIEHGSVTSMFSDNDKNIWIGFQSGNVLLYDGSKFKKLLNGQDINNSQISDILQINNKIFVVSQNGGIVIFEGKVKKGTITETFNQFYLTTVEKINETTILAGSFNGLFILDISDLNAPVIQTGISEIEGIKIQDIEKSGENKFLIATEDEGLYEVFIAGNEYKIHKISFESAVNLENLNIQDINIDRSGDVWLSTFGQGVVRLIKNDRDQFTSVKNYNNANGLSSNDIKHVFQDIEGNFWIGTYNDGLACLTNEAFMFYAFEDKDFDKNITAIATSGNITWYASGKGIIEHEKGSLDRYTKISSGLPNDKITALHYDKKYLWVGTQKDGLFRVGENGIVVPFEVADNTLARAINHITGTRDSLWVSTKGGIYLLLKDYSEIKPFSTNTGLSHNDINQVYVDRGNNAWVSTKSKGLMYFTPDLQPEFIYAENLQEMEYVSIKKDANDNVWAAVKGFGVIMFGEDTLVSFNSSAGLKSNYCYSLEIDKNNNVWVGHRMGLSKINIDNFNIKSYTTKEGIYGDCNQNALVTNRENELVFGTTDGIIIYNPERDTRESMLPILNLTSVRVVQGDNEMIFDVHDDIVLPYNKYSIRFEFIGLYYKDPESVKYQYMLEGYDDWNGLTNQRFNTFGNVDDGNYVFKVKACNAEKMCTEIPVTFHIKVEKPFWKTWWFIVISVSMLVMVVIVIIKVRERQQKALQEYLQRNLDERTREVVKQKEEIEIKNRDITDSINYAQRIQASILPSIKTLQTHFSGSFVFYQPRDIVSGDFYWFGLTKNNKFIVVCADSTGHGVPGAFMSMIGTILIKDICAREDVVKPSDILNRLDVELSNTLNQNIEAERSNDGMDITVCEIDIKTYYTRVASAMRPIVVYQNGQQIYVKGSRNSVGGHVLKEEKVFENEGFQLGKGDLVYMFSDGYPDQFGGPMEKKFKMVRLKNLLKDINQKPMDEQFTHVKNTFNVWKEGLEQVDDVLFMGIKI